MELVSWSFNGLEVPMIDIDGNLFCTSKVLQEALGVSRSRWSMVVKRHKDEFEGLQVTKCEQKVKDFLNHNKESFLIKRINNNLTLWSEDEMIVMALLTKGPRGTDFRKGIIELIKSQATRGTFSKDAWDKFCLEHTEMAKNLQVCMEFINKEKTRRGESLNDCKKLSHLELVQ